jgi:holo-[acyl-carrier protein] synthase
MVLGLGVDLIEMERVARALDRWDGRLVDKLMGPEEAARLPPPGPGRVLAIARAIAAKEAASKAIGTGWTRGVRWRDVVLEAGPGPSVRLDARAGETARRLGSSGRTRTTLEVRGGLVLGEVRLLT